MERFQLPAPRFKFAGEKIEQFRMTRFSARDAKVIGGAHQADTEMMLPDAIDHEPGNDRVVRGGEPVGKREASSGAVFDRCDFVGIVRPLEDARNSGRNFTARFSVVPANENEM